VIVCCRRGLGERAHLNNRVVHSVSTVKTLRYVYSVDVYDKIKGSNSRYATVGALYDVLYVVLIVPCVCGSEMKALTGALGD
jgi:hypothetical protein